MLAVLAGLCFLAITYWWLRVDTRGPDNDAGRHLNYAWNYFQDMRDGDLFSWFTEFDPGYAYPPLIHLVGAVSLLPGGRVDIETAVFGLNVVFLPMLVAGAYGVGSIAGDRRTGLLAVLVALGTPMVISMFHSFMTDGALTAVVALSVWLILRTQRFTSTRWTIAAGVAVGLGLMTKSPFVFFVAGLLLVVLARGGWRQWKNLLVFAGVAALVAAPWYVEHFDEITSHTQAVASFETPTPQRADSPYPERWTLDNFVWYGWNALNTQAYLPLVVLFLTGLAITTTRLVRRLRAYGLRGGLDPSDVTPELLVGGAVGYFGISYLGLDDPRYSLPLVVYCAVLATAWVAHAKRLAFVLTTVAVVAIVAANTAVLGFGWGPNDPQRITLYGGGGSQVHQGEVTLLGPGYVAGPPDKGPQLPSIFTEAERDGVHLISFAGGNPPSLFFGNGNLDYVIRDAGLTQGGDPNALGPNEMVLYQTEEPTPGTCTHSEVESDIYFNFRRGDRHRRPFDEYPPYCPVD